MIWATPVVNVLSSLPRYTASDAISSAVPSLPIGCRLTNISRPCGPAAAARSSMEGVSMVPGQMQLQRMPLVMKSTATARVSAATGREHAGQKRPKRPVHRLDVQVEREIPVLVGAFQHGAMVYKTCRVQQN